MIELRNITKTYEGGFTALEDVNLQISDGEFVFIVGGSGAGKSTLTKLLIAEDKPTSGSISVDNWELGTLKRGKIPYYRRKLGIVFQDFRLFPEKTVYENVAFALRVIGEHSASIRMKVNAALRMVELSEKGKCYPGELSGGEQQRVALARALANSPGVIIADEPTGNIDPVQSRELMELFCRIQSRYQKTVIVLTHDRELAESFGQRMVRLQRGKIVEDVAAYTPGDDVLAEMMQASEARTEVADDLITPILDDEVKEALSSEDMIWIDPVVAETEPVATETVTEALQSEEFALEKASEEPADGEVPTVEAESPEELSELDEISECKAPDAMQEELPAMETAAVVLPTLEVADASEPEDEPVAESRDGDAPASEEDARLAEEADPEPAEAFSESEATLAGDGALQDNEVTETVGTAATDVSAEVVTIDALESVLADLFSESPAPTTADEGEKEEQI